MYTTGNENLRADRPLIRGSLVHIAVKTFNLNCIAVL